MIWVLALVSTLYLRYVYKHYRERCIKKGKTFFAPYPIPKINLGHVIPLDSVGAVKKSILKMTLPGIDGGKPGKVEAGTTLEESFVLAQYASSAKNMFEFGTCTGRTTYLWALNSPASAKITTLTLAPNQADSYTHTSKDSTTDYTVALKESVFLEFFYSGQPEEKKITQLYGDSKTFDGKPFKEHFDLIFIDGSHAYSYVLSDSEKALSMLKPGGTILWHDYRGPWQAKGVYKALNELSKRLPLRHIASTSLVIYTKP
jgi:predicted O-methyltransferase YrrM